MKHSHKELYARRNIYKISRPSHLSRIVHRIVVHRIDHKIYNRLEVGKMKVTAVTGFGAEKV